MNSVDQTEDLRAFERRIMEYISYLQPSTSRWRGFYETRHLSTCKGLYWFLAYTFLHNKLLLIAFSVILAVVSICTATGAWLWLMDPNTSREPFLSSLWQHPFFTLSSLCLILLFLAGIHKRVVAPSIIVGRMQTVLEDFNMSCDESGRLILKPRPEN